MLVAIAVNLLNLTIYMQRSRGPVSKGMMKCWLCNTTQHSLYFALDRKISPTQPGWGIRKIVNLYHNLTVLLNKARKQSAIDALDSESVEEMEFSDFKGMTEEEIEEE